MQSQQVRVQLFSLSNKVTHVNGSSGTAEYTDSVKESRKSKHPLRFGQGPSENCLQHDARDQSDEGECLPDTSQQLRAVEIVGCPDAGILRIRPCREGCTSQAGGQ